MARAHWIGSGWGSDAFLVPSEGGDWVARLPRAVPWSVDDLEREVRLLPLLQARPFEVATPRDARVVRDGDGALVAAIHDAPTGLRLDCERAFLAGLDGSCQTPIAGLAELEGGRLRMRGEILRPDGSEVLAEDETAAAGDGAALGAELARRLRARAPKGFFEAEG